MLTTVKSPLIATQLHPRARVLRHLGVDQGLVRQPNQDLEGPQRILPHLHQRRQPGEGKGAR